jgi:phosphoribulokinase
MASSPDRVVMIGVAGDSGCGKSTFLRRLSDLFGSDLITTICLDDYHSLDRYQRKEKGITALDPRANNFDLMYEQAKALKSGQSIMKPIYNHETGLIDPPEQIKPNRIIVLEGLHPLYDQRVRNLLDFKVYLDLSSDIKVAWKVQRDMAERGHTYEDVLRSIEARRPDFEAYIDVQKQYADAVIEILPTKLLPELDKEHKILRVRLIQREGVKHFEHAYLFDEGSTIDWLPCGKKLTCSYPGLKLYYGPSAYFEHPVSVLEIDGQFDNIEEILYLENHLSGLSTHHYGEMTELLRKNPTYPGSKNGSGLIQVIVGLKIRAVYEQIIKSESSLVGAAS